MQLNTDYLRLAAELGDVTFKIKLLEAKQAAIMQAIAKLNEQAAQAAKKPQEGTNEQKEQAAKKD